MNRLSAWLRLLIVATAVGWTSWATAQNQTATLSPILSSNAVPFSVQIELAGFSLPSGLHSFVTGTSSGTWLLLAGRINRWIANLQEWRPEVRYTGKRSHCGRLHHRGHPKHPAQYQLQHRHRRVALHLQSDFGAYTLLDDFARPTFRNECPWEGELG